MKVSFFFSRGVSLELWLEKGLFEREKLFFEAILDDGMVSEIYWFTYGSNDKEIGIDLKHQKRLDARITIVQMPKIFSKIYVGDYIYSFLLPIIQHKALSFSTFLRTNQTEGSWSAVLAKLIYNKKLIYRTGYTISQLESKLKRRSWLTIKLIEFAEKLSYFYADHSIVSSKHSYDYVVSKYSLSSNKISVINNFVDQRVFYNKGSFRSEKMIFVGRLSNEKNISSLIIACHQLNIALDIYGSGPLENELKSLSQSINAKVNFKGNVANTQLNEILNSYMYFALVSFSEGMPKALLEALASGCICVGTNVEGISEVLGTGEGLLSTDTSSHSIAEVIRKAINLSSEDKLNIQITANNRVERDFSLSASVSKEIAIFQGLLNEK